jgi:hypothetical protein
VLPCLISCVQAKRAAAKRRREADGGVDHEDGFDSQDSDFEDLRGVAGELTYKTVQLMQYVKLKQDSPHYPPF